MDYSTEKLTLSAEIGTLSAQLYTEEQLNALQETSDGEYASLMDEISTNYQAELEKAQATRDEAVSAAQQQIENARTAYDVRIEELGKKKEEMLAAAADYYAELLQADDRVRQHQQKLKNLYNEKIARLEEIKAAEQAEAEKVERARIEAEEKARAEEEAKKKSTTRPKLYF